MEQRQLRLGDILDDYCPRERRLTNHAVVAMVGAEVKQTRCTTCEAEHEYKHAKLPRQRRKPDSPAALYARVASDAPKHASQSVRANSTAASPNESESHEADHAGSSSAASVAEAHQDDVLAGFDDDAQTELAAEASTALSEDDDHDEDIERDDEEGPVHRQLIRASLPREGQPPASRPIPEFTIRQPTGRHPRFRPRPHGGGGGGQQFQGNRANGNGPGAPRGGGQRPGGRPPQGAMMSRPSRRHGPGRKRSK